MRKYKNLDAWKTSMDLVTQIYKVTGNFPPSEQFGLTSQIRRAAISVPSNIAEGTGRQSDKECIRFFYFSLGSIMEIDTQVNIALNLDFIDNSTAEDLFLKIQEVRKLIYGLIRYRKQNLEP